MTIKNEVLRLLEQNKTSYISGQHMAESLGVSRAAVWKAIRTLSGEGYVIDAVTHKGYRLDSSKDILSSEAVGLHLKRVVPVYVYESVDSTNITAQKLAFDGAPHGTVVLAENQTKGRGRLGRSFYSPEGSGIYMSVIIRPQFDLSKSILITAAASVAVAQAIEEVAGVSPSIKWVNDIYINDRKVCGILCQAVTDFQTGQIGTVIAGIGINCTTDSFPDEIREIAGCVPGSYSRNELAAKIADNLLEVCDNIEKRDFIDYYRSHSMVTGKDINIIAANKDPVPAKAIEIDENGGLVVIKTDGTKETLTTGEVSIRIR